MTHSFYQTSKGKRVRRFGEKMLEMRYDLIRKKFSGNQIRQEYIDDLIEVEYQTSEGFLELRELKREVLGLARKVLPHTSNPRANARKIRELEK